MKLSEAIEHLEEWIRVDRMEILEEFEESDFCDFIREKDHALSIAIAAMEKQMLRKPKKLHPVSGWECPVCKVTFGREKNGYRHPNYCYNCGQRVTKEKAKDHEK